MLHHRPAPPRKRSWVVVAIVGALTAALLAIAPGVAFADPPNPSDQQIGLAQAAKDALAAQVGSLTAQLQQLQTQVEQTRAAAELAEQKVALALQQLADARDSAATAKQNVVDAQLSVDSARKKFNTYIRQTYQSGSLDTPSSALLTSSDPTSLLQASALQTYVANHQIDGIGELTRAEVGKANADSAARAAVALQTQLTQAAKDAQVAATAAAAAATAAQASAAAQEAVVQAQLDTAQATLLGLQNQRAAYEAWKVEQERIRQAAAAAAAAALLQKQQASGGGTVSTGAPTGGSWSADKAANAIARARGYLGMAYSWAAGGRNGPTFGQCGSGDAGNNDCHVYGFDCSGLTLYAWAPYLYMAHYAATQYSQAGSYHPGTGSLLPGDLVFWSSDGTQSGIHHVAMYIGGGNVIQAPQSGDVIKITPLGNVAWGYYGATRPLT